jgi:hypothetical protein
MNLSPHTIVVQAEVAEHGLEDDEQEVKRPP